MRVRERFRAVGKALRSSLSHPELWLSEIFTGGKSKAGIYVDTIRAMNISAVFAAIRLGAETIGTLPVQAFRKTGESREPIDHPVGDLFAGQANPEMAGHIFRETMQGHLEARGNAYAEIVHDKNGFPIELWPIHPSDMQLQRNPNKALEYIYVPTGEKLPAWKVFHLRGLGSNGLVGYSVIKLAKESFGLTAAAEEYGSRYFGEGTNLGGFLQLPEGKALSDEAFKRLKAQMNQKYKGLQKSHGLIVLEGGARYEKIGLSPEDSQFLETRKFQVTEIARWFRFPPHMIGDLEKATFSNIEHQGMEAVRYSWLPRVTRWEAEISSKLLFNPVSDRGVFVRFNLDGLLRGDIKTRYESYHLAMSDGWMNADEARAREDMGPQEDGLGKMFLVPLNMVNKADLVGGGRDEPEMKQPSEPNPPAAEDDPEDDRNAGGYELRAAQSNSIALRRKIGNRYRPKIRKAADSLVKAEVKMIRGLLEANEAGDAFITSFIERMKDSRDTYRQKMGPILSSYASDLYPVARDEVGEAGEIPAEYEEFVAEYINQYGSRHAGRTRKQILAIANDPEEDTHEGIEARLAEWEEKRAKKIEEEETTRGRSAFVKAAYGVLGVTFIRSVANGKSCPFCTALDGKVIGINSVFFSKGESFQPEGAKSAISFSSNIGHAPYHEGCDCDVVAELGGS